MKYLIYGIIFLTAQSLAAQITFNHRQNLGFEAFGYSSVVPVDSGYFLTGLGAIGTQYQGHTQSVFAFADTLGQIVWHKAIIGEGGRNMGAFEGIFRKRNDTSFITVGVEFGGGCDKTCLYNYNARGDTVWMLKFPSIIDSCTFMRGDALCFTNDGGFLVGTSAQPQNWDSKIIVTKTDSVGNELWHEVYGDASLYHREEWPLLKNFDGQLVLVARHWKWIWATTSNYDMQHQFWWLDSVGNILNTYTTPNIKPNTTNIKWQLGLPRDLIKTKDGGWLMGTSLGTEIQTAPPNPVYYDAYLYKLDSNHAFQWDLKMSDLGPGLFTEIVRIFEQADSNYIVIGTYPYQENGNSIYGGILAKVSPQGDSLWARKFYYLANNGVNLVYDARQTPDGGYVVCGESRSFSGGTPQQGWLLKLDSMGCLVPGCHITAVDVAQTPDAGKIDIKVFPNPAVDYINVYVPRVETQLIAPLHAGTPLHLHLYDLNGRLLQNHTLPQSDATYMLTTEGLASGLYLLQVLDGEGKILGTEKVVVRK